MTSSQYNTVYMFYQYGMTDIGKSLKLKLTFVKIRVFRPSVYVVMKIKIIVVWVMSPCIFVVSSYQHTADISLLQNTDTHLSDYTSP
jgi:hypothetical protein